MEHIDKLVRERRSVRTFSDRPIAREVLDDLVRFMNGIQNPFGVPVRFALLNAKEHGLSAPVISGGDWYIGAAVEPSPYAEVAYGFSFETMVLYAQSLGLGTTWIGGTMNRGIFERAMDLRGEEQMLCVTPLGYPAEKMALREMMMRKGVKADARNAFGEVFFDADFRTPLTVERAGKLAEPLELVRLGPSAVNKQPWRVVVTEAAAHFYVKAPKGIAGAAVGPMQKIDMGIALCHFALGMQAKGMEPAFRIDDPKLPTGGEYEYIASYLLK